MLTSCPKLRSLSTTVPFGRRSLKSSQSLAFALMLEIRRSAKLWTVSERWGRLLQSVFYLVVMMALVLTFSLALSQLITHSTATITMYIASNTLSGVATFLLLNPLTELFLRANLDWREIARILRPGSQWWKVQRASRLLVKRAHQVVRKAEANLALADRSYLHGRKEYKWMRKSEHAAQLASDTSWLEGIGSDLKGARERFLARYPADPDETLADLYRRSLEDRRRTMRLARKILKQARKGVDSALEARQHARIFSVIGVSDDIFAGEIEAAQSRLDEQARHL